MNKVYLAADFGAGSGRIIAGRVSEYGRHTEIEEIHRFPNRQVRIGDWLYWDFPALFADMKEGLAKAVRKGLGVVSIGVDTWGVDFGLVDRLGNLIGNPVCYRDPHPADMPGIFFQDNDPQEHYEVTGTQVMAINTIFRLMSMNRLGDPRLEIASRLLFMPDLFNFYLTGHAVNEYTIASTSELLDARSRRWADALIEHLGVKPSLFGTIVQPGTVIGTVLPQIAEETGLSPGTKVVAVGSHDTASAVYATQENYADNRAAFLSSGTWSLLGVVLDKPVLSAEARAAGFTNEGGVDNKIRFLTNITGLWILQRLAARWKDEGLPHDWPTLTALGEESACKTVIDVDDPMFGSPDDMAASIVRYCLDHGLEVPVTQGDFVMCVCLSLALRYKKAVEQLNRLLPCPVERLRIFGGGCNNALLNRLTAEATGLEITCGPVEATAIGNILVQARALS